MNTSSVGLRRGRISSSALPLLVMGALLAFMALSPQTALGVSFYVVDKNGDSAGDIACTGAANDCSLRGAMSNAVTNAGADMITFDSSIFPPDTSAILPPGQTITVGSGLPVLSNNGDTIDAVAASVAVEASSTGFSCFTIAGNYNVIKGIDVITGCFVGIEVTGVANTIGGTNTAEGTCSGSGDEDGDAYVNDGCPDSASPETPTQCANPADNDGDTLINDGCPPRGEGMTIKLNSTGVLISGGVAYSNVVEGNFIGTSRTGDVSGPNGAGVVINGGAYSNIIGGMPPGGLNLLSGNSYSGVAIGDPGATDNTVSGNYIGLDITGAAPLGNSNGVEIFAGAAGNTIGAAGNGNIISGNSGDGVRISDFGTTANTIRDNFIGLDAGGATAVPNLASGVEIVSSAYGNNVGVSGGGNVISGNNGDGVYIGGGGLGGSNDVQGNFIGTNAGGTADLGNALDGVYIASTGLNTIGGGTGTTPGGSCTGACNLISGNNWNGMEISGVGATGNIVQGNFIGTDVTGALDRGNSLRGVYINTAAAGNSIGGASGATRNVISGNDVRGVEILGAGVSSNAVTGNYVGTNSAGTAAVANTSSGVVINNGASSNTIGGTSAAARNVISGNAGSGVGIANGASSNVVQGNFIGTNASGNAGIPNTSDGVQILSDSLNNVIGGVASGAANSIAFNTQNGVCVMEGVGIPTGNNIRGNSIFSNGKLGIDLVPAPQDCTTGTVTTNDPYPDADTGPNDLQNFPVISSVVVGSTTISGSLVTASPETAFVDVYASDVADGSTYGEGRAYLGTAVPDTFGAWSLTIPGVPPYTRITATATKGGSTSEFSASYTMSGSPEAGLPSTAIAYKGQASPIGSTYNFFGPGQVPNTSGEVVFWSSLLSGCPSACTQGIFRWLSGTTTKYVATGDVAPDGGTFSNLADAPVVNASGDVAFWAATSAPTEGIYHRASGGAITKLVSVGGSAPGGSTFLSFDPPSGKGIAVMNNLGDVSFWASLASGGQGVYLRKSDGTLLKAAATGDATPAGGTFSTFLSGAGYATIPIVTENQEVAFRGFMSGGPTAGLFLYSQGSGLTKVAATGDTSPVGGTYSTFGRAPSPNDGGQVAFWANLSGSALPSCPSAGSPCGVFVWEDGVTTKAFASGDAAPAQTGGLISDLGTASFMNDAGQITAWAGISSGLASQAIVRYTDGYLENVAAIGNTTAIGGTFSDFIDPSGFPTNPLLNNQGRVVYWGDVSGGSGPEGVFITNAPTIDPEIVTGPVAGASAPGTSGGTFGAAFDLDINGNGSSVFANTVTGGTANSGVFLFFAGSPGAPQSLQDVALQGQTAPGGGSFSTFHPPVNNDIGQIVFRGATAGGPGEGLYLFFAGSPQPAEAVALKSQAIPIGEGGSAFSSFGDPAINNLGYTAAQSTLADSRQGLYLFFAGSPDLQADSTMPDGTGGNFATFGTPALNNNNRLAARATLDGSGEGLYLFFAGSPTPLAKTAVSYPGIGTFTGFGDPVINLDNRVVAKGTRSGGQGLYLFFAGYPITPLATTGVSYPGIGTFTDFGPAAMTDGTDPIVVFRATAGGSEGLFLFFAGSVYKIVQQGDAIPNTDPDDTFNGGSPVFPYLAMNNDTQVVYVANVQNGATAQGVFVANLDADSDTVRNYTDNCPANSNLTQINTDASLASTGGSIVGDNLGDACDDDWDNDDFSNAVELGIATNPKDNCSKVPGPGTGGDAWPPDFNIDFIVDISDVNLLAPPVFFTTSGPWFPRRDLQPDGIIDISDVNKLAPPTFFKTCT